jgi:hypothetical protein
MHHISQFMKTVFTLFGSAWLTGQERVQVSSFNTQME